MVKGIDDQAEGVVKLACEGEADWEEGIGG